MSSFSLEYDGYWREEKKGGIPSKSGVYSVYTCAYDKSAGKVALKKLIYIGESGDVSGRIANHEKWPDWRKYQQQGEQICFSFAPIPSSNREQAEAALIFKHKPPVNTEYVDSFPFPDTTINTTGMNALLKSAFTVKRT